MTRCVLTPLCPTAPVDGRDWRISRATADVSDHLNQFKPDNVLTCDWARP